MRKLAFVLIVCVASLSFAQGDREKELERVQAAGTVIDDIMAAPDKGIPQEILTSARCVAVVPSLLKGGFILGGAYGRGVALWG